MTESAICQQTKDIVRIFLTFRRIFEKKRRTLMYTLIVNDFLDTQVNGIFTTQYIEQTEMLLRHNLSGARVKIVKEQNSVATFLFSMTNGWLKIQCEEVSGDVSFVPLMLPKTNEEVEALEFESTIEEYRKYNGLRYLKNLAILLGEDPANLDEVFYEIQNDETQE